MNAFRFFKKWRSEVKKVILWIVVLLCLAPVTLQAGWWGWGDKNKEERKASQVEPKQEAPQPRPTLKEKTPEEKQAAVQKHLDAQVAENKAFQQSMQAKQMDELKVKLAQNTKLTEAQKNEILSSRTKQYEKNTAFGDQRRSENNAFFQNFANDPSMTEDQKRSAIRAHYQSQKSADHVFRQQQKAENKAEREKIRSEASSENTAAE